ncbi:HNH endonuclease [Bacillus sp. AG4(2022)]|uniref:HNH endonuclease n=1 Tax=Bacillus sp. AG4(2022) TaxID=2962594 RepID=UPI00288251F3|nr:HNH endonuclease [Bacillus sp. AG4(2022)]MDT0160401.1 HNH endonuclease [Bacillus sp. AG4(2022)]
MRENKNKEVYIYYNPECKSCTSRRVAERRKSDPEYYSRHVEKQRARNLLPEVKDQKKKWRDSEKGELNRKRWETDNKHLLKEYQGDRNKTKKHIISKLEWEDCKKYFNHRCAYCGLAIEEHYIRFSGKIILGDFHKEHVDDQGANDLSNCVPSCKQCNSSKHDIQFEDWYNDSNKGYSLERRIKIHKWLDEDYRKYKSL